MPGMDKATEDEELSLKSRQKSEIHTHYHC